MELVLEGALLAMLLAASAFFAACEVAFLSFSNIRLQTLLEKNVRGAQSLSRLKNNRRRVVITLLIGNNIANIAASAIAASVAISVFGDNGLSISVGVMSFLILTFGEIVPKSFATTYGEMIMLTVSPVIEALYWLFYPLVIMFEAINHAIPGIYSRATGIEKFTEEEVRSAVKLGAQHKSISERERQMIENVLEFNDKAVEHAMTPKARVVFFPAEMLATAAHEKALASTYSRYPVIKNGAVVGTVNLRALSKAVSENPNWRVEQLAWPPVKMKKSEKLSEAFSILQERGRKIAIVVDEKHEFIGIITMEDLLEELVGKIG